PRRAFDSLQARLERRRYEPVFAVRDSGRPAPVAGPDASMTTTLIVRDATLAINGAPEKRREPREHLRLRVAEVAHMEERTAEECVEVLTAVAGGDGAEAEVLEALVIV